VFHSSEGKFRVAEPILPSAVVAFAGSAFVLTFSDFLDLPRGLNGNVHAIVPINSTTSETDFAGDIVIGFDWKIAPETLSSTWAAGVEFTRAATPYRRKSLGPWSRIPVLKKPGTLH
jgi:hypothetical protein